MAGGNPVPSSAPQGTGGRRVNIKVFNEVLVIALILAMFLLVIFILCLLTRQNTLFFANLGLLAVVVLCIVAFVTQETYFLAVLFFVTLLVFVLEVLLATWRIVTLVGYCDHHNGCIEAFIPYAVCAGVDLLIAGFLLLMLTMLGDVLWVKDQWDKLNVSPGPAPKPKPAIKVTPEQMENAIYEAITGRPAPSIEDLRVVELEDQRPQETSYGYLGSTMRHPKYVTDNFMNT